MKTTIDETITDWPYLLPTLRGQQGKNLYHQFYGSVKARIALRQKQLWSMFIGAGFIAEDIKTLWPEQNLEFFGMRYSEHTVNNTGNICLASEMPL